MTALPGASRPLTRLTQTSLVRSNGSSSLICARCQTLASDHHTQLQSTRGVTSSSSPSGPPVYPTSERPPPHRYGQKKNMNIVWGTKKHFPKVQQRPGKRQRLIEAGRKGQSIGAPQLSPGELRDVYAPELFLFRSDVTAGNLSHAMQSLENLIELEVLSPNDTHNLAQAIHQAYRSKRLEKRTVINYLKTTIDHIKAGHLPSHYLAHVHILSTFKEAEEFTAGNEYWNWLRNQGLEYLDARVFGAVIEFLAYQGAPIQELENLYAIALEKFAKVEDAGGGMQPRATRLMLVQGIISARLLAQDWKKAYESFDLCARLHPTQVPSRVYEMFIFNRPIREGYLVYLMACRAGTKLSVKALVWVTTNWWKATNDIGGVLQLTLAQLAVGGRVSMEVMGKIIYGLLGRLPEAPEPPAPLHNLVKQELEGGTGAVSTEEEIAEREAWVEWERKMEEYQIAVNPMFGTIRRVIEIFRAISVEPDVSTYCNIISQAARRHLRPIVAGAIREVDSLVRSGRGHMEEGPWRVILSAYGSLADQDGVKKAWQSLTLWRRTFLKNRKGVTNGRTWIGGLEDRAHELISWKSLIRACFQADLKAYVLEQLQTFEHEFDKALIKDIRQELVRCEGRLQKIKREEAELLHEAVTEGKDSIATAAPTVVDSPVQNSAQKIPQTDYEALKAEAEKYDRVLDSMETVIKSPVAYDFSTLDMDLGLLGIPEMTEEDARELKSVYDHFQNNMPRNPFMTATHDPKSDLAGIQRALSLQTEGAWGNERSVTGYTINQLRFENWLSINRLLFLAERGPDFKASHLGAKGVTHGSVRRETKAKAAMKKVEGLQGRDWEEEVMNVRWLLVGSGGRGTKGGMQSEVNAEGSTMVEPSAPIETSIATSEAPAPIEVSTSEASAPIAEAVESEIPAAEAEKEEQVASEVVQNESIIASEANSESAAVAEDAISQNDISEETIVSPEVNAESALLSEAATPEESTEPKIASEETVESEIVSEKTPVDATEADKEPAKEPTTST
ncbi:hypothetical protein AA313_de0209971 [Arthrobotrys entomopaga]|nr:hypothetical protein AA313_de0209971 [Arthrobotrys entomopaga]